jgi:hypothetical protein|tara:strand:- start:112 stop:318 length:207 start_codon:yes stop_codon:yes gene_type:complete
MTNARLRIPRGTETGAEPLALTAAETAKLELCDASEGRSLTESAEERSLAASAEERSLAEEWWRWCGL